MSAGRVGGGRRSPGPRLDDAAASRVRPRRGPPRWPTSSKVPNPRKLEGRGDPLSTVRFLDAQGPVVEVRAERGTVSGYSGGKMRVKAVEYFTFGKDRFYEIGAGSIPGIKGYIKDGVDVEKLRLRIEAMLAQGRAGGAASQRVSRGPSPERIGGRAAERRSTLRGEALDRELLMSRTAGLDDVEYIDVPEVDLHESELQQMIALRRQCADIGGERRKELLLPSLPVFAGCSARFAEALQRNVRKVLLRGECGGLRGQCIATAGSPSERRMYVVATGRLEVSRGAVLVRTVVDDGTFGEANLVGLYTKWECDVEASVPTMLYEVTADAMRAAVEESPKDAFRFPWLGDEGFELGKSRSEFHRWRALRRCTPLKGCSELLLRELDSVMEVQVHFPGEELVREGSLGSDLVLVEGGEAQFELAGRAVRSEVVPSQRVVIAGVAGSPSRTPDASPPHSPRKGTQAAARRELVDSDRAARSTVAALPVPGMRRNAVLARAQEELRDLAAQEPEAIVVGEMNLLGVSARSSVTLRAVTACLVRRLGHSRFMEILSRFPADLNTVKPLLDLNYSVVYPPLEVRHVGLAGASDAFWKFLLAHVEERVFCAGQRVTLDDQHRNIPGKMPKNLSFCRLNRGSIQVFQDQGVRAWRGKASKDCAEEITEGEFIHGDVFCDAKILQAREACFVSVLHRGVIARAFEELPEDCAELLNTVAAEGPRAPKNSAGILRERSIFSGASPEFIRALEAKAQVRVYMPGDRIIRQTDEGTAMYILWVGSANVVSETEGVVDGQRTRSLSNLGALIHGAVFGELAMLGQRRVSGIIASTVCCTWEVGFHLVRDILQGHPAEQATFVNIVEQTLDKLGNQQVGDNSLFADFSQHFRTFIGVNSEKHLYFEGQTILQEGTFGDRLYIVNLGTARVEAMGQRLPPTRGGAHFGYGMLCRSSSLAKEKYHVSVTAESMCQVFVVTRAAFQAALKKYPDMRDVARALEAKEAHEERLQREQANQLVKQQAQRSRYLHSFMQACARLFDYSLGEESSAKRRVTYLYFDAFRRVVAKIIEDRAIAEQTRQAGLQQIDRWISRRREQLEQVKQQQAMKTLVFQSVSQRGPLALPKGGSQKRAQSRQGLAQSREDARSPYLSPNPQWKQTPAMPERVTLPSLPLFSPLATMSPRGSLSARPNTAPAQDVVQPVPSGVLGQAGPVKPASARGISRRQNAGGALQDPAPSSL